MTGSRPCSWVLGYRGDDDVYARSRPKGKKGGNSEAIDKVSGTSQRRDVLRSAARHEQGKTEKTLNKCLHGKEVIKVGWWVDGSAAELCRNVPRGRDQIVARCMLPEIIIGTAEAREIAHVSQHYKRQSRS